MRGASIDLLVAAGLDDLPPARATFSVAYGVRLPTTRPAVSASRVRRSVRGSTSARPVMAVLDLLGRRWTMRILWELREHALPFRALQERCDGVSPTVLNERLRELRDAELVALREGEGYGLTADGRALGTMLVPLNAWAERRARRVAMRRAR
jgi:DNA-binding HxlR family transcriptional regulator